MSHTSDCPCYSGSPENSCQSNCPRCKCANPAPESEDEAFEREWVKSNYSLIAVRHQEEYRIAKHFWNARARLDAQELISNLPTTPTDSAEEK